MTQRDSTTKSRKRRVAVSIKASLNNTFVLKLLSISLTIGLTLSIGVNLYDSSVISSQSQTIASQNLTIASKSSVINSQNVTITNLQNESSVRAYEALKAELASTQTMLQNATAQLKSAQSSITSLQVQLTQARGNASSLQALLTKANADVSSLQAQLTNATNTVSSLRGQIGVLNQQVSQLQTQVSSLTALSNRLQRLLDTYLVQVSGGASSKNGGTTATWVYFYSNGERYGTPVTSNVYSFKIPNNSTYEIFIQWNSALNEGVCDTGQGFMAQGSQLTYHLNNATC